MVPVEVIELLLAQTGLVEYGAEERASRLDVLPIRADVDLASLGRVFEREVLGPLHLYPAVSLDDARKVLGCERRKPPSTAQGSVGDTLAMQGKAEVAAVSAAATLTATPREHVSRYIGVDG